jgi:hypothetical protein
MEKLWERTEDCTGLGEGIIGVALDPASLLKERGWQDWRRDRGANSASAQIWRAEGGSSDGKGLGKRAK